MYLRTQDQEEEVEQDVQEHEQQFERRELQRTTLVAQVRKGNTGKSIHRHHNTQQRDELAMVGVAQRRSNGAAEHATEHRKEQRGGEERHHGCNIHRVRVRTLFVGKAEEPRLHAVGEDDQQQRRPCVEIGYDTIVGLLRQHIGVERHQQPVEKLTDDRRKPVDSGLLRQDFHRVICHVG